MSKADTTKTATFDELPPKAASGAEAYARWLEHMQRTRTRHAAITRNLYSWSNYKSWAEKMRHDWQSEDSET